MVTACGQCTSLLEALNIWGQCAGEISKSENAHTVPQQLSIFAKCQVNSHAIVVLETITRQQGVSYTKSEKSEAH